jgi:hypothetical protein
MPPFRRLPSADLPRSSSRFVTKRLGETPRSLLSSCMAVVTHRAQTGCRPCEPSSTRPLTGHLRAPSSNLFGFSIRRIFRREESGRRLTDDFPLRVAEGAFGARVPSGCHSAYLYRYQTHSRRTFSVKSRNCSSLARRRASASLRSVRSRNSSSDIFVSSAVPSTYPRESGTPVARPQFNSYVRLRTNSITDTSTSKGSKNMKSTSPAMYFNASVRISV